MGLLQRVQSMQMLLLAGTRGILITMVTHIPAYILIEMRRQSVGLYWGVALGVGRQIAIYIAENTVAFEHHINMDIDAVRVQTLSV